MIDRHAPGLADSAETAWSTSQICDAVARIERAIASGDRAFGIVPAILRAEVDQLDRKWRALRDEVRLRLVAAALAIADNSAHGNTPDVVAQRAISVADAVLARLEATK